METKQVDKEKKQILINDPTNPKKVLAKENKDAKKQSTSSIIHHPSSNTETKQTKQEADIENKVANASASAFGKLGQVLFACNQRSDSVQQLLNSSQFIEAETKAGEELLALEALQVAYGPESLLHQPIDQIVPSLLAKCLFRMAVIAKNLLKIPLAKQFSEQVKAVLVSYKLKVSLQATLPSSFMTSIDDLRKKNEELYGAILSAGEGELEEGLTKKQKVNRKKREQKKRKKEEKKRKKEEEKRKPLPTSGKGKDGKAKEGEGEGEGVRKVATKAKEEKAKSKSKVERALPSALGTTRGALPSLDDVMAGLEVED